MYVKHLCSTLTLRFPFNKRNSVALNQKTTTTVMGMLLDN